MNTSITATAQDDEDWPWRRRLQKSAEIFKDVCVRLIGQYIGDGRELDQREIILFAALLRCQRMMTAIELLAVAGFMEDAWALMRSMSEWVIDACYLQICPDIEVDRFTEYTDISYVRYLKNFEREMKVAVLDVSDAHRQFITDRLDTVKLDIGLTDRSTTWSAKKTPEKVRAIDEVFTFDPASKKSTSAAFASFALGVFASGHPYVHPSHAALEPYIKTLQDGSALSTPEREERIDHVLNGAVHCLFMLTSFANIRLQLGLDEFIHVACAVRTRPGDNTV
jgi:hypothetical protein